MIKEKYKKVSVVGGAGHIGLPLSCFLQNKGCQVTVIDNNLKALNLIKKNVLTFYEKGLEENLKTALGKGLKLSDNIEEIINTEVVIVTIGTSSNQVHIDLFEKLINDILEIISNHSLLILRSTITMKDINTIKSNEHFVNKNINLAYCPERIAEGEAFEELEELPQIVGAAEKDVQEKAKKFFQKLKIPTISTSIEHAIFTKLFTNAYRHASFSLANEFYNIALENKIDFEHIRELSTTDYPRLNNLPLTGYVGGPCLPKDLETFIKSYNVNNSLLNHLENVNEKFLDNIVHKCEVIFKEKKLIQLGLSFKINSDDIRGSGSIELYKKLKRKGFEIYPVDPYINKDSLDFELFNFEDISNKTDNILISVNHDKFKKLNFDNKKVLYVEI